VLYFFKILSKVLSKLNFFTCLFCNETNWTWKTPILLYKVSDSMLRSIGSKIRGFSKTLIIGKEFIISSLNFIAIDMYWFSSCLRELAWLSQFVLNSEILPVFNRYIDISIFDIIEFREESDFWFFFIVFNLFYNFMFFLIMFWRGIADDMSQAGIFVSIIPFINVITIFTIFFRLSKIFHVNLIQNGYQVT